MDENVILAEENEERIVVRPVDLTSSAHGKLELVWPGKDLVGTVRQSHDGTWTLLTGAPDSEVYPFINLTKYPDQDALPSSLVLQGDRLLALRTLRRSIARSVRLAYLDVPRIKVDDVSAAFRGDTNLVYSAWLSVVRTYLLAIEPLLDMDGVIIVHAGETESGAARLLADEVFRGQHIGTIVWQRSYAPRNMRGMRDFTATHDCLICYAKQKDALRPVGLRRAPKGYSNFDGDPRGPWKAEHKGAKSRRKKSDFPTYVPPYRWRIIEGQLPPGLWRISPMTGVIWGKPTEPGDFPIKVEASDSEGQVVAKDFHLKVTEAGEPPAPPEIPWLFKEIQTSGDLRIETEELPAGIVGKEYSAICLAAGGAPHRDEPKRPGSGRYWEFAQDTLVRAYQQDSVYLGKDKPTAIPHPKSYEPADGADVIDNQQTWWPGRTGQGKKNTAFAGYTEDATKHLKALQTVGAIADSSAVAKPEMLLARLVDIFTQPDDLVLEVFCQAGDLASVALKRDRRFIALTGSTDRDRSLTSNCIIPRLCAVVNGEDNDLETRAGSIKLRADGYIPYEGGGSFATSELGEWIVRRHHRDEFAELNTDMYEDLSALIDAVLTGEGFMPVPDEPGLGKHFVDNDRLAYVLPPDEYLTPEAAASAVAKFGTRGRGTLFYFRASPDFDSQDLPTGIIAKRIPFDLGV